MRYRVCVVAALLAFASSLIAGEQGQSQKAEEAKKTPEATTMAGMRDVVPALIVLGWDDFFLNSQDEANLSPAQVQELLRLRLEFAQAAEDLKGRLLGAQVTWFEELNKDQVSGPKVEMAVRRISDLRGELAAVRFQYLLRAINTLNHEQHKRLATPSKVREELLGQLGLPQSRYGSETTRVNQNVATVLRVTQGSNISNDAGVAAEVERCNALPAVSVQTFLGYRRSRDAAKALMNEADRFRKAVASSTVDWDNARALAAQIQSETESLDLSSRVLETAIAQTQGEQFARLQQQLRTESAGISQDLSQAHSSAGVLARRAEEIKGIAKRWRRALGQVDYALCLSGKAPSQPVEIGTLDRLDGYWWDARAGRYRPKLSVPRIIF